MTAKQDELLAKHDGRYFAIGKFNAGLAILVKAEKLGKEHVNFGVPSSPALFLNLARKSFLQIKDLNPRDMFYKWQNGLIPINHSDLFDYFESYLAHIVFSFTSLEAFANEVIPKDFEYKSVKKNERVILKKPDIERMLSLEEKLHSVLPKALNVKSPKGTKLWQHYKSLKTIRDRIIHLKSVDYSPSGPEKESIWGIMLRFHGESFCDYAHQLMNHYKPAIDRRWYQEYPYLTMEPDRISDAAE